MRSVAVIAILLALGLITLAAGCQSGMGPNQTGPTTQSINAYPFPIQVGQVLTFTLKEEGQPPRTARFKINSIRHMNDSFGDHYLLEGQHLSQTFGELAGYGHSRNTIHVYLLSNQQIQFNLSPWIVDNTWFAQLDHTSPTGGTGTWLLATDAGLHPLGTVELSVITPSNTP